MLQSYYAAVIILALALSSVIISMLSDPLNSLRAALAVLLLFAVSGFIATLFMRETYCRNIRAEKSARENQS